MIVHSVCTMCSLIPYYHPHGIAFCLYNMFTYSILPSTWYCILLQRVHLFRITHPHDIAFCLYNMFTYSILPSTWYCILCVQRVHLFHITIHMIMHSVSYNVSTYSILPSTWYCILFVQGVHLVHITIHMILHSVCTTCSLIPYYHPHDIAFCLYNVVTYSILKSTRYCILCVQHVHLFHITIHMILHSVCITCPLIPYYHPHDSAFCVYNVFAYSMITIHTVLHSVCTTCSLPYYHPHDIAFCYNVFTYPILPSAWYCILFVQSVHLVHITIRMILHSVCMRSLIPYYHPHDIAFCLYVVTYSILKSTRYCILCVQRVHLFHITIHMILHTVCTTCPLIPYYHPHDSAFCVYNVFAYSIFPSTW